MSFKNSFTYFINYLGSTTFQKYTHVYKIIIFWLEIIYKVFIITKVDEF